MKIRILIIIILIQSYSLSLVAQRFDAGFTLGVAATQVDGDGYGGYNKAGPIAGIWVEHNLKNEWFGRIELRYTQKGSYAKTSEESSSYYRMRLHYYEAPIFVGYRLKNKFQVMGGFSVGYLGKAQEMTNWGSFPDEDIDAYKEFEFAGIAGVEYRYRERWIIGAFASYSILPIRPHKGNITYRLNRGQYNQVLELAVRFKI